MLKKLFAWLDRMQIQKDARSILALRHEQKPVGVQPHA